MFTLFEFYVLCYLTYKTISLYRELLIIIIIIIIITFNYKI